MDNFESLVCNIGKTIREKEDEFIISTMYPYAKNVEMHISKDELKKAIKAYYRKDVVEVVRCKDCFSTEEIPNSQKKTVATRRSGAVCFG